MYTDNSSTLWQFLLGTQYRKRPTQTDKLNYIVIKLEKKCAWKFLLQTRKKEKNNNTKPHKTVEALYEQELQISVQLCAFRI